MRPSAKSSELPLKVKLSFIVQGFVLGAATGLILAAVYDHITNVNTGALNWLSLTIFGGVAGVWLRCRVGSARHSAQATMSSAQEVRPEFRFTFGFEELVRAARDSKQTVRAVGTLIPALHGHTETGFVFDFGDRTARKVEHLVHDPKKVIDESCDVACRVWLQWIPPLYLELLHRELTSLDRLRATAGEDPKSIGDRRLINEFLSCPESKCRYLVRCREICGEREVVYLLYKVFDLETHHESPAYILRSPEEEVNEQ